MPDLGIIVLAELALVVCESGIIKGIDGKRTALIQISESFERMFNFKFGDIYDKKDAILNRKPYNLTKGLDTLKTILINYAKKNQKKSMRKLQM